MLEFYKVEERIIQIKCVETTYIIVGDRYIYCSISLIILVSLLVKPIFFFFFFFYNNVESDEFSSNVLLVLSIIIVLMFLIRDIGSYYILCAIYSINCV